MSQYHLKRLTAPRTWKIARKTNKYITKPLPGGQPMDMTMPLNVVLIGLGHASTKREVKNILKTKPLLVDGKQRHSFKHPVGFMDVLSLPESKQHYRVGIGPKGLKIEEIKEAEAGTKLAKITGKKTIKKGKTQLSTHDGRCVTVDKDTYKVGDTILLEVPSQKIKGHFKFEKGATMLLTHGTHQGVTGKVEDIQERNLVFTVDKNKFETRKSYAFVLGK